MSEAAPSKLLDAQQIVFLPGWARITIAILLGFLAVCATITALAFFQYPELHQQITPVLAIAQTLAGACVLILFVTLAERRLSTPRLLERTDYFLESGLVEVLRKIEVPQVKRGHTIHVDVFMRENTVHGGRKDIYGANYELSIEQNRMKMWVGIKSKAKNWYPFGRQSWRRTPFWATRRNSYSGCRTLP